MSTTSERSAPSAFDRARSACHEPFVTALDTIERQVRSGVLGAIDNGRERHAVIVTETRLADDPPEEWEERSARLLDYRRRVSSEVLEPILRAVRSAGPTSTVAQRLISALSEAAEAARAVPEYVEEPWEADALTVRDTDGVRRRVRKSLARLVSRARHTGQSRQLPLRAVTRHHVDRALSADIDATASELLRDWAKWSHRIELAWVEWGDAALPALVRAEIPRDARRDDEDEERREDDRPWHSVRAAARTLDDALDALCEEAPLHRFSDAMHARLGRLRERLQSDLKVAGSFVYAPGGPPRGDPELKRLSEIKAPLESWDRSVAEQLHLYESILSLLSGATAVRQKLIDRLRDECLAHAGALPDVADELGHLSSSFEARTAGDAPLPDRLERLSRHVQEALEATRGAIPDARSVDRIAREASEATVDALLSMIRQTPATLELHPDDVRLPSSVRGVETRRLHLQELARQAFDALRIERIRSSTADLVESIGEVRSDVAELPDVFAFAYQAAKKELEEGRPGAEQRAVALATEALASMTESLRTARRSLDSAVERTGRRLATEFGDGSLALLSRVTAGGVEARLLALRSLVSTLRTWVTEHLGPPALKVWRSVSRRFELMRRLATRGLRKGSEIVGSAPSDTLASSRTLKALSDVSSVVEGLPLVYQRLFTLDPLRDESLLAGRERELADAMARWARWTSEDGVPLIVRGRPGSGVTSFMEVFGARIDADGGSLARVGLDTRHVGEASLATRIASVLELGEMDSLDALTSAIFDTSPDDLPDAVTVDDLEHVYLREPGGTDLIERLLTLMAETEPRIFWIGGITSSAWQVIKTAEPAAISQVEALELEQLSGEAIREALMVRHRRSGLRIRFEEPGSSPEGLRHRWRKLRDPDGYEDMVAEDFFERLARSSGRHLRLALYQWLATADFTGDEGVVMRPPERPDFSVLDGLDLMQSFTLKSLLEHRTLTLHEHDRIFRLPRHESYQVFESLGNRHLIEAIASESDGDPARSEIEENLRYRVRPLVVGAVIAHLRSNNIFH